MTDLSQLSGLIAQGDATGAADLVGKAVAAGSEPGEIIDGHIIPAMDVVGRGFEAGELFLPEMLVAADATKAAMAVLEPLLAASEAEPQGRIVIGTVEGDVHDIGKNLVASMLVGGGFGVTDIGIDVPPDGFVAATADHAFDVVALSALLSTTKAAMVRTIEALEQAGIRPRVKVIVGGAPITQAYADEIGADGYGRSAVEAVSLVRDLLAR